MSQSSDLRSWARLEWRSVRGPLAFACVASAIVAIATWDLRLAIVPVTLVVGVWALWLTLRMAALVVLGAPTFAIGKALRSYVRARQTRQDVESEMRKPRFEQR